MENNMNYTHIYTGNGKGKTTAAFGLAIRAAMSGMNVYIGQFVKDMKYNETKISEYVDNIDIEQLGIGCFIDREPTDEDRAVAEKALKHCQELMLSEKYKMVILDELTIALYFKLISEDEVLELMKIKPDDVELVITGRYATAKMIELSDLVTEMKEIKHYYNEYGVLSREGIEF